MAARCASMVAMSPRDAGPVSAACGPTAATSAKACWVGRVIRSPQTAVHFVTTLEEMPVQETLDGLAELRELTGDAIRPGGVFINMVRPAMLDRADLAAAASGSLDVTELALGLKAAGI